MEEVVRNHRYVAAAAGAVLAACDTRWQFVVVPG